MIFLACTPHPAAVLALTFLERQFLSSIPGQRFVTLSSLRISLAHEFRTTLFSRQLPLGL